MGWRDFRREFLEINKGKYKKVGDSNEATAEIWKEMSIEEREPYRMKIFYLQNFPLNKAVPPTSEVIGYWIEERVNEMVKDTKDVYVKVKAYMEKEMKEVQERVMSYMANELLELPSKRVVIKEKEEEDEDEVGKNDKDDDEEGEHDKDEDDPDIETEEQVEVEDLKNTKVEKQEGGEDKEKDRDQVVKEAEKSNMDASKHKVAAEEKGKLPIRRSKRKEKAIVKSPWMPLVTQKKRKVSDKQRLYGLCIDWCTTEDGREMTKNPSRWNIDENAKHIIPEHLGYNLGDCDFIFGPTVVGNHWFCFVLELRTMKFYIINSMVDHEQLKAEEEDMRKVGRKGKGKLCLLVDHLPLQKEHFRLILVKVKPELSQVEYNNDILYPQVFKQENNDDCEIYLIMWLKFWNNIVNVDHPPFTMPKYTTQELSAISCDILCWLVKHPNNVICERQLSLVEIGT
ncbi:uncharacterized protein LOC129292389 [Prosopis cineraria]|uniref:uncharacterized protein LOC129292389 n=1 Tax=Prosopis cineraria TaxID=364024 RepID=UPI00241098A6|nr:uncharacterized protein LOC129292389 [Prosopis cineraria]